MIKAKRFWENVEVRPLGHGYGIALDERILKTPNKNELILPTLALAEAVAEEWRLVEGEINPNTMPMTRLANSSLERIPTQRADIEAHLLEYIESDLICYRADAPAALVEKQTAWDAWVQWAGGKGIKLHVTQGVMAVDQPEGNRAIAENWLGRLSDFELMAFHEFLTLTGSFVLAMAVIEGTLDAESAFDLSRIDDDYQAEAWGQVEEKDEEREAKAQDIRTSADFLAHLRNLN